MSRSPMSGIWLAAAMAASMGMMTAHEQIDDIRRIVRTPRKRVAGPIKKAARKRQKAARKRQKAARKASRG